MNFLKKKTAFSGLQQPSTSGQHGMQRGVAAQQASEAQLRQWFAAIDRDRNGTLDVAELQRALALGNLHFSLQAVAHMIRIHDKKGSYTINFDEFQTLHQFLTSMQTSFVQYDADRSGALDRQEVWNALSFAGFRLDQPAFEALFKAFDPDRSETLNMLSAVDNTCADLAEYIGMTLFLQSATATFTAFDSQRTGRISLDFNQWIYATSNVV